MNTREAFFTKDKTFYRTLFPLLLTIALQNLVAYSVNMADNIMLGSYSQTALSGAATVNQLFFVVQQLALGLGDGLVALASQYWGQNRVSPIRRLTGIALKFGVGLSILVVALCSLMPYPLLHLFTPDEAIVAAGMEYLSLAKRSISEIVSPALLTALSAIGRSVTECVNPFWENSSAFKTPSVITAALAATALDSIASIFNFLPPRLSGYPHRPRR